MGDDALFDIEGFDDVFPRFVIQMEHSLMFGDVVGLDFLGCTCDSRVFKNYVRLGDIGSQGHGILTESG